MLARKVRLGLIQISCSPYPEENLKKAAAGIAVAARSKAQIVSLQELFRTEYFCQTESQAPFKYAEPIPGPTTEALSALAKRNNIVLVGSIFEKANNLFFNSAVIFDPSGKLLGKYRKVHVPDDLRNHYGEAYYFSPGDLGCPVFETPHGKIGLQVCYDQWFPEGARALAKAGAEIILYPTAIGFPSPPTNRNDSNSPLPPLLRQGFGGQAGGEGPLSQPRRGVEGEAPSPPLPRRGGGGDVSPEYDAWITIQRGHAISNGVFVAACNRVGAEGHIQFWGSSFVADPMGKVLGMASAEKEENLVVECDLGRIKEVREDWPFLNEYT